MKTQITIVVALLSGWAFAQDLGQSTIDPQNANNSALRQEMLRAEQEGIEVRIKDVARFRGVRSNQLSGVGLVVGLEGTGDTQGTPFTRDLVANALKRWGTSVDPSTLRVKNIAAVWVTAELPPFAAPGNQIDVTVNSIGDAKSLQGGTLLPTALFGPSLDGVVYALAQGPLSIGGFNFGGGGSSVQKNHTNVGRVPSGAIVERGVDTQFVFEGNTLYLELDMQDLTTAQRMASQIQESFPEFFVRPIDGGTVEVSLPADTPPLLAMSQIGVTQFYADIPAVVVINERTGTIVIGGNVKLAPAVIAHGSLQVRIDSYPFVSQPLPLSQGVTVAGSEVDPQATEETAQIGVIEPSTTVSDLARILTTMRLTPRDIIAIFQMLKANGSLKARLRIE